LLTSLLPLAVLYLLFENCLIFWVEMISKERAGPQKNDDKVKRKPERISLHSYLEWVLGGWRCSSSGRVPA
jgi:hypothetical protein